MSPPPLPLAEARHGRHFALAAAVAAACASLALNAWLFDFRWADSDHVSYEFQARLFAGGRAGAPAPPDPGLLPSGQFNVFGGRWTSKYPFGNALALAPGVWLGAVWLVPALAAGAFLIVLHRWLEAVHGPRVASIGTLVALVSPATLVLGATLFSESVSRLALALFLLSLARIPARPGSGWPLLAGLSLGYALNTRTLTALVFGAVGTALALLDARRAPRPRERLARYAPALAALAVMAGLFLAWNRYATGDPLRATHNADQPFDRLGYGPRGPGHALEPETLHEFTPGEALRRLLPHTLPCISHVTLGLGYYRARGWLATWPHGLPAFVAGALAPLLVMPLLALLGLLRRDRTRWDLAALALVALNLAVYSLYYFDATLWSHTPVAARYHNEVILLGLVPLVARGLDLVAVRLGPLRWARPLAAALGLLAAANLAWSYAGFRTFWRWRPGEVELARQVAGLGPGRGVVYCEGLLSAPLGDYPFADLARAELVYYRLGDDPEWRLGGTDWRTVHARFFADREPWLFRNRDRRLVRLR